MKFSKSLGMRAGKSLSVQFSDLENIFPFYLLLDSHYTIVKAGRSMKKLFTDDQLTGYFFNTWRIISPTLLDGSESDIRLWQNKLLVYAPIHAPDKKFKGQVICLNNHEKFAFIGTPVLSSSDQLYANGLDLSDFALHDNMLDFFQVIKNNEIVNSELKDIVSRINTQRKALAISEEKYRSIIANMNLGLLEVDNQEIIQYANQSFCEMCGYELSELIHMNASELFASGDNRTMLGEKIKLRERGVSDAYEVLVKNKRGEIKCWLISGAPRYNSQGELIGSIGIHLDITNQKEIEYQLIHAREMAEQSAKAKESFLANMSHEIRTPLNGIIGMIRVLNKESLTATQKGYVDVAHKASKHLLSIINNILDFSRIEAGELKLTINHFCLTDEILDVYQILRNQADEKNLRLKISNDKNLFRTFIGDSLRIRQILLNVVGNAIKFSTDGAITISTKVLHDHDLYQEFYLKVVDHGIGMDEAFLKNIFTKFHQEDISTSRKFGGSGLGLVITKELVDLMNGKIEVQSKKGKGTDITITLRLPKGSPNFITKSDISSINKTFSGKTILLVEDNEMNRLVVKNVLSPYHFTITEAENGKIALDLLRKSTPDLILMDLQMPVMDGIEATTLIKNDLKLDIPIIALTANAIKAEIEKCKQVGMVDYVMKPFEEDDLIEKISFHLNEQIQVSALGNHSVTTQKSIPDALYDLTKLREMSGGNDEFVIKMLQLFIQTGSEALLELKSTLKSSDFLKIRKITHRLKPSIDHLDIPILSEIKELEKLEIDIKNQNHAMELVQQIIVSLSNSIEAIRKNEC